MDIKGRKFKDNSNGKIFTVVSVFDNIAILDNRTKIAVSKLVEGNQFSMVEPSQQINESNKSTNYLTERNINPDDFLNNKGPSWVNNISKQVGNINTSNLSDNIDTSPMVNMDSRAGAPALRPGEKSKPFGNNQPPQQQRHQQQRQDNTPIVQEEDPEFAKQELLKKYAQQNQQNDPTVAARRQMESLKKYMDEEDITAMNGPEIQVNDLGVEFPPLEQRERPQVKMIEPENIIEEIENNQVVDEPIEQEKKIQNSEVVKKTITQEDPIIMLFNNAKRNYELKFNLELDKMIPNPSFIALMEDSYSVSIIDFLADEFTKKIISDPEFIKGKIKEQIEKIVYNKENDK